MGMYRFEHGDRRVKPDAIVAFLLGVVAAYVIQVFLFGMFPTAIFTTLIVVAVGGLWYHWRKIL